MHCNEENSKNLLSHTHDEHFKKPLKLFYILLVSCIVWFLKKKKHKNIFNILFVLGELSQKTDWHRVCVFKPGLRDAVFNYLRKGQRVHVSGRISYGSVTEDNTTKANTSIIADDVIFFGSSPAS